MTILVRSINILLGTLLLVVSSPTNIHSATFSRDFTPDPCVVSDNWKENFCENVRLDASVVERAGINYTLLFPDWLR